MYGIFLFGGGQKPSLCISCHMWPISMKKVLTIGRRGRSVAFFKSSAKPSCLDLGGCFACHYSQNAATCPVRICLPFQNRASVREQRRNGPGVNWLNFLKGFTAKGRRKIAAVLEEIQEEHFAHETYVKVFYQHCLKKLDKQDSVFYFKHGSLGTTFQEIQLVQKKETPNYSHHNMDTRFHRLFTWTVKLLCQEFGSPKSSLIHCII